MSGSIAAIAAYNGKGTQGYATTDKGTPGVKSIFWNKLDTEKTYVNGSSLCDIPSNISVLPYANFQNGHVETVVFDFGNDFDAVGDMFLTITLDDVAKKARFRDGADLPVLIKSVELCVGNQVIISKNTTEILAHPINSSNTYKAVTTINMEGFAQGLNGKMYAYLMACASNQRLQLKIYPNNVSDINALGFTLAEGDDGYTDWGEVTFSLNARVYTMVNEERNFLRNQPLPKDFVVTQSSQRFNSIPDTLGDDSVITVNCDHFNLDASTISVFIPSSSGNDIPVAAQSFDIELFLNSTSYAGIVRDTAAGIVVNNNAGTVSAHERQIELSTYAPTHGRRGLLKAGAHLTRSDLIPFSKFDSIRVNIYPKGWEYSNWQPAQQEALKNTLTVHAAGYTTAFYENGAVTFSNF